MQLQKLNAQQLALLKNKWMMQGIPVKDIQQDHLVELKILINLLIKEVKDTGQIPKELGILSKNLIGLTDKMRKQDEGIKVQQDLNITQNEFRDIIDIEAKRIKNANRKKSDRPREIGSDEKVSTD